MEQTNRTGFADAVAQQKKRIPEIYGSVDFDQYPER